ncbi:MAG: DUF4330 domain-containing protein [Defluviitaleaceae bacterium]|nr:DUF4330 domain-containing protein [Defluviitaleaceae bacterium]
MSKSKPKFNIIDALVILVILVVIAAGIWFLTSSGAGNERYVYFVVEFQEQLPDFEDRVRARTGFAPEAEVRDSIRNLFLGHAWDVWSEPATLVTFDNTSETFILETIPDRYDVYVLIRGVGTENESAIMSNGQIVRVGQEMFIAGNGYTGIGFVTQIWTTWR